MMSVIVRTISRSIYPFILVFGFYIVIHGHLTPGGAFPGGVLLASAAILLTLAYGISVKKEEREVNWAEILESDALIAILAVFLFTIMLAKVLPKQAIFSGPAGTLFSGGSIPLLNISGGIEVLSALLVIFLSMVILKKGGQ
jgi:multicomponent Na+:H+ antiporter subunit B